MNNNTTNQAIIINDLLSFLSCKIKVTPREKLLKTIRDYYPEKALLHAQKTLLDSLPEKKSTRHGRRVKHPDPVIAMYDCFQLIPDEDLPVFVCQNLNNVPHIDVIKTEKLDDTVHDDYDDSHTDIKEEQKAMKSQIADIADVVQQIKDQLKHIVDQQQSPKNSVNLSRKEYISTTGTKRKKSNTNSATKKFSLVEHKEQLEKSPKKTMAYLQQLIDEEEEMKSDPLCQIRENDSDYLDENDMSDTDLYNDILSEEERNAEKAICEVLLKEGAEGFDQSSIQSRKNSNHSVSRKTKGTPLKVEGQKVIYIKNEEDFDIPSDGDFLEDGSDSIEISSADNIGLGNLEEIDASSRVIQDINHEERFEGEIEHVVNEDEQLDNTCPECGCNFESFAQLTSHLKTHFTKKLFECILCCEKFLTKQFLRQHYTACIDATKDKYGLNNYPCPTCGRLYAQGKALKQHSYMHSLSRPYVCKLCSYRYLTQSALDAHVKTQHNPENKYFCPFCDHSYISIGSLKNHILSHTGERPFGCKECSYKAATADLLKRHMLTHGPPKQYTCDVCSFECVGNGKLSRHKAKEHKKESITCLYCLKEFKNSCVYHRHYMSHVGERPFQCSMCSYAAISKEVLMGHMKTHTGINLIHCPQCSVPFATKYSLKRHLKSYCFGSQFMTEVVCEIIE